MRREYFEQLYADNPDPWGFTSRWYEQRKYALSLGALTRPRYRSVFEPGCSIGVLTAQLAVRCDHLLSVDLVSSAVGQARRRVANLPPEAGRVVVQQWDAHGEWPSADFDLIVVSEMLYYLDPPDARRFMDRAVDHLDPDGEILLVHWRERVPEYPLTGDEAHEIARATDGLECQAAYADDDLLLDVLARSGTASTATREGLRQAIGPPRHAAWAERRAGPDAGSWTLATSPAGSRLSPDGARTSRSRPLPCWDSYAAPYRG